MTESSGTRPVEESEAQSKWPRVLGVISLVYAIFGLVCGVGGGLVWAFLSRQLMKMGGMDVQMPQAVRIQTIVSALIGGALGILLLLGAVALLRRRPAGVTMLKAWAILRLVLLVVAFGATIALAPAQMEFQREIREAQNERMREAGRQPQEVTDEGLWKQLMLGAVIGTVVAAIYPAFLGWYLSRRRVREEVAEWTAPVA